MLRLIIATDDNVILTLDDVFASADNALEAIQFIIDDQLVAMECDCQRILDDEDIFPDPLGGWAVMYCVVKKRPVRSELHNTWYVPRDEDGRPILSTVVRRVLDDNGHHSSCPCGSDSEVEALMFQLTRCVSEKTHKWWEEYVRSLEGA
jgi:hypothetical protein